MRAKTDRSLARMVQETKTRHKYKRLFSGTSHAHGQLEIILLKSIPYTSLLLPHMVMSYLCRRVIIFVSTERGSGHDRHAEVLYMLNSIESHITFYTRTGLYCVYERVTPISRNSHQGSVVVPME